MSWLGMVAGRYFADGSVTERGGNELAGSIICYRPYAASDGWVTLGALEPKFWQAWCKGVGREDLIEHQFDPPGSDAHREVERGLRLPHPRGVAPVRLASTTAASSPSSTSTRRSTRS